MYFIWFTNRFSFISVFSHTSGMLSQTETPVYCIHLITDLYSKLSHSRRIKVGATVKEEVIQHDATAAEPNLICLFS